MKKTRRGRKLTRAISRRVSAFVRRLPTGLLGVALVGGFLIGCASEQGRRAAITDERPLGEQRVGAYKVGKPYQIAGVWYYPKADYNYDETGIGSWYGPGFHGKITANGETYDQFALTAAHPTLPMPSVVRVTNLDNGRSIKVRINDRGPFKNGRIIDLSRRGAELLGFIGPGTAKVRVQIVEEESRQQAALALGKEAAENAPDAVPVESVAAEELAPLPGTSSAPATGSEAVASKPAPTPAPATAAAKPAPVVEMPPEQVATLPVGRNNNIYIQAGAFLRRDYAASLSARLSGYGRSQVSPAVVGNQQFFRVRLGPLASVNEADRLLQTLIGRGHKDARVVVE